MTKLNQDNVSYTWCIRAVPISVFSRGDNCGISKGMKITRTILLVYDTIDVDGSMVNEYVI